MGNERTRTLSYCVKLRLMLSALDKLIAENARLCYCDTVPTTAAASYFDVERGGNGRQV